MALTRLVETITVAAPVVGMRVALAAAPAALIATLAKYAMVSESRRAVAKSSF